MPIIATVPRVTRDIVANGERRKKGSPQRHRDTEKTTAEKQEEEF
jgi:hypothetical protein